MRQGPDTPTLDLNFPHNWQQQRVIIPFARHVLRPYFRARCHGLPRVPEAQACIYVAKHPRSVLYLETMLLGMFTFCGPTLRRPFRVLEKSDTSLHKVPGVAWLRRHVGALPASEDQAVAALREGQSLLIFPGGAKELYGAPDTLRWSSSPGFARLAARAQVPVVPVAMVGADQQHPLRLPLGRSRSLWLPLFPLPVQIDYWYGMPLPPPDATPQAIRTYAHTVRNATEELLRQGIAARRRVAVPQGE